MSIRSDIPRSSGWFNHEKKTITIHVTDGSNGTDVNLDNINISWRILKSRGSSTVFLTKKTGDVNFSVGGNNTSYVTIIIDPATDYNSLADGIHHHELWDNDNSLELSYGDVNILRSRGHP